MTRQMVDTLINMGDDYREESTRQLGYFFDVVEEKVRRDKENKN